MSAASPATAASGSRSFYAFNAIFSVLALASIAYLLLIHRGSGDPTALSFLPAVNASLNALSACCLVAGFFAIRLGARRVHPYLMTLALGASALFFASYLAYHYVHGDTKYPGHGAARTFYLLVLASHVLLSVAVVPLALSAFFFAWRRAWVTHKRTTRLLLPIWLYVSVTGVAIFFLLRRVVVP
jgi:putative membrane protein